MPTLQVQVPDQYADRRVILAEFDEAHPTDNHEIYIVGYPGEKNIYEVGDTAGVLGKIAAGELVELGAHRRAQPREVDADTRRAADEQREADEKREADTRRTRSEQKR